MGKLHGTRKKLDGSAMRVRKNEEVKKCPRYIFGRNDVSAPLSADVLLSRGNELRDDAAKLTIDLIM